MKSSLIKLSIFCLALFAVYFSALAYLFSQWNYPDYNYCYLIPFIVLYLVWEKRKALLNQPSYSDWKGLVPFIVGISFFWLGELGGEYYTLFISFWLVIIGTIWLYFGWRKLKTIIFPVCLALAMFPFPDFINTKFSFQLRLISSRIGVNFLHLFGYPAYREGNVIDLSFVQLQVVDACSGLRYLFPLFILSLLVAYFSKTSLWKRLCLVFSTIPLAIITNSMRIALTGVIFKIWGEEFAEGFFHGFSGWLIFIFCFFALMIELWILNKIHPSGSRRSIPNRVDKKTKSSSDDDEPVTIRKHRFAPPQFFLVMLVLIITLLLSSNVEFREKTPIKKPFNSFPSIIGNWAGTRQTMDKTILDTLDLSDYLILDFRNNSGNIINFYVAYYESQRKGESIHSPETCIPGGGWVFTDRGINTFSCKPGLDLSIKEAFIQKGSQKQLVYYWFPQRGRILTNAYQLKFYLFWDAITKQRTDGALVRLITPLKDGENLKSAEKRLQQFICQLLPVLNGFLPD